MQRVGDGLWSALDPCFARVWAFEQKLEWGWEEEATEVEVLREALGAPFSAGADVNCCVTSEEGFCWAFGVFASRTVDTWVK